MLECNECIDGIIYFLDGNGEEASCYCSCPKGLDADVDR